MSAVVKVEPQEVSTSILQVIERAAENPNVDVEKMERLFALQERILMKNAEVAFNTSMQAAQQEMPKILRNRENTSSSSRYADLEKVNEAIVPVYTKHGFSLSFGTADCPLPAHARITCLVSHIGGHSRTYQGDIPLDLTGPKGNQNKTGVQGFGSTTSYGRRYLTLLIFNITLTNEDNDGQGEFVTEEQIANLTALATEVNANMFKFLAYLKVKSLPELASKHYTKAIRALEAQRGRK